jgi:lysine-ketoglutarate reductase/saccharopine dehydrogenase-like protein (TIGR00300 family)
MFSQDIELRGHIIDSLLLPKVLDEILSRGGSFKIREIQIGRQRTDPSRARIEVSGPSPKAVDDLIGRLRQHGAEVVQESAAQLVQAPADGMFPPDFYATTNQQTFVHVRDKWIEVEPSIMDSGISVDEEKLKATAVKFHAVRKGMPCVVGHRGIRVIPLQRSTEHPSVFEFMASNVSSEKPKTAVIREVADEIRRVQQQGGRTLVVAGPAVVHTGAGEHLEKLIERGYVHLLFAGNALAAHDIEHALYGTSLGVDLKHGALVQEGHENHLHAINTIRAAGGIANAVRNGVLKSGIMYQCVKCGVEFVLAGSIRDDGPLPEVITDTLAAQKAMCARVQGVSIALMMGTMLHSIAVGNLLPAHVKTICVDISPAVVTKLTDRGTFQAIGLVTDIEPFLRELTEFLLPGPQIETAHVPPASLPA